MAKNAERKPQDLLILKDISVSDPQITPLDRSRHAQCLCSKKIYIHGGKSGFRTLNDFWGFDLDTATWESLSVDGQKPGLLTEHFMVDYNSYVYLIGHGFNNSNRSETQVWSYSEGKCWTKCQPLNLTEIPSGRQSARGAVIEPKLYIFGGVVNLSLTPTSDLLEFDLDTFSWKIVKSAEGSDVPPALYDHSCISFRNCLYIFGGIANRRPQNILWQFDTHSGIWKHHEFKLNGPLPRHGHAAVVAGRSMFIYGGQRDEDLSDLWQFDLTYKIWTEILVADPLRLSYHGMLWLPSVGFTSSSLKPEPYEEPIPSKSAAYSRTISQEHLIAKDNEHNSLLRRLSSRRNKKAFVNDGIELSDLREDCENKPAEKGLPNMSTEFNKIPVADLFQNEPRPKPIHGRLIIVGGENGLTQRTLRIKEIDLPANLNI